MMGRRSKARQPSPPSSPSPPDNTPHTEPHHKPSRLNKLPQYDRRYSAVWIRQLEAACAQEGLTSELQKFTRALLALDPAIADLVIDIDEFSADPFTQLKTRLKSAHEPAPSVALNNALQMTYLGDNRPSDHLRALRRDLPSDTPNEMFRHLLLKVLPEHVRITVAASTDQNIESLASLADQLIPFAHRSSTCAVEDFENAASDDTQEVHATKEEKAGKQRSKKTHISVCIYHYRYKGKAKKCIEPCDFKKQSAGNDNAHSQER